MNGCQKWRARLFAYAVGELRPPEARTVERHLKGCAGCARAVGELRARAEEIDAALRQVVQGTQPVAGFHARVLARVHARSAPFAWRRWRVGVLAAVTASVLVAALLLRPPMSQWRPAVKQPTPAPGTALSAWHSPTDTLLRSPGDELLRSGLRLGRFYFRLSPDQKPLLKKDGGNRDET